MSKIQLVSIFGALCLFALIFFGLDTRSDEVQVEEKNRAMNQEVLNVNSLIRDAKKNLSNADADLITLLERKVLDSTSDSTKVESLKSLASAWYDFRNPIISAHYAEMIADEEKSADAYSISGTTFMLAMKEQEEDRVKTYCSKHALEAFEHAISLEPKNVQHRINHALCSVEHPPKENPMKGILELINLNKTHPDNASVLYQLGRLGIQTGQFEKAVGRLKKALELEPTMSKAHCLLSEAYNKLGDEANASIHRAKCN